MIYQTQGPVAMATKFSPVTMTPDRHAVNMRPNRADRRAYAHRRKSAVELLEASKSSYVKSSTVLNNRQELKHPENLSVGARDSPTVLALSHSRSDYELSRKQSDRKADDTQSDKVAVSNESPNKTPPAKLHRRHSPPVPKGVDPVKVLSSRRSPPSVVPIDIDQTDSPRINMSDTNKVQTASSSTSNTNQDQIIKRFSSLSANAAVTMSKDPSDKDSKGPGRGSTVSGRSNERDSHSSSQSDAVLKPMCYTGLSTSVNVLVEHRKSSAPRLEKTDENSAIPRRKQLHRSHSDLSSCRHSRTSSDFSDLSSRLSRTSTEIERFFNEMGIDRFVLDPMLRLQDTKRTDFLDNLSSIDSNDARSLCSGLELDRVPAESEQDLMERSTSGTSVVERNARIIKWLYNVKKARTSTGARQPIPSS